MVMISTIRLEAYLCNRHQDLALDYTMLPQIWWLNWLNITLVCEFDPHSSPKIFSMKKSWILYISGSYCLMSYWA